MPSYRSDPRWITAKWPGKDRDGAEYKKGDRVFYYPLTKTIVAGEAAEKAAREFASDRADEEFMGGLRDGRANLVRLTTVQVDWLRGAITQRLIVESDPEQRDFLDTLADQFEQSVDASA